MHILILGGSSFVGRALAVEAVSRAHKVTLFNRGSKPAPAGTSTLHGDRHSSTGLAVLEEKSFDAVIDTWSGDSSVAIHALEELIGRVQHYTFISSASVYDQAAIGVGGDLHGEEADLFNVDAPDASKSVYPFHKRNVEIAIQKNKSNTPRLFVRPGIILGPHEAATAEHGRLTWWLDRISRGGRTLAPGPKDMSLQFIDVRDLARFIINASECRLQGAYNLLNKPGDVTIGQLLDHICYVTGNHAELVWKSPNEIIDSGIKPFSEVPLWVHPESKQYAFLYGLDTTKAQDVGLICRPFEETIQDTWDWMQSDCRPLSAIRSDLPTLGLPRAKESRLLELQKDGHC